MTKMRFTGLVLFAALFLAFLPAWFNGPAQKTAVEGIVLKDKLPADTLCYVGIPDFMKSWEDFKTLPLYKLWQEEEIQAFLKQPLAMLDGFIGKGKMEMAKELEKSGLPITTKEVMGIRPGSWQFALIGPGDPTTEVVRFAGVVEMAKGVQALNKLVEFGVKQARQQLAMAQEHNLKVPAVSFSKSENGYLYVVFDFTNTGSPLKSMTYAYKNGTLVMASSKALADTILGSNVEGSLSTSPEFKQCFAKLRSTDAELEMFCRPGATIKAAMSFLPMIQDRGFQMFMKANGDKINRGLEATGLLGLKATAVSSAYLDGKATFDSFTLAPAPRKGFLALMDGATINRERLAWVPKDAVSLSMSSMPVAKLIETLIGIASAADKQMADNIPGLLQMAKMQLGVDIKADFLDLVGGDFILYSKATTGLGSAPPMIMMVEVKEAAKFVNSLETLLTNLSNGEVTLEKSKDPASGVEIWSLEFDLSSLGGMGGGLPMTLNLGNVFKPTFAFHKGFMVAGLAGSELVKAIRLMDGKGKSILENKKFIPYLAKCPKSATSLSFSDLGESVRSTYELLSTLIQFAPVGDLGIDLALLPGSDTVSKHFFPIFGYSTTTDEGSIARTTSPIGPEVIAGLGGAAVAGAVAFSNFQRGNTWSGREPEAKVMKMRVLKTQEPIEDKPEAEEKKGLSRAMKLRINNDMDNIAGALMIYKLEKGEFPAEIGALLTPLPGYPQPGLNEKELIDPWHNRYQYKKTEKGYKLWSFGPNGVDDQGKGDDCQRIH